MPPKPLLPVADALASIEKAITALPAETLPLSEILGRYAACDYNAALTSPAQPVSAMDGYAARFEDVASLPRTLIQKDISVAGKPSAHKVQPGEVVRIFTGAVVPTGADTIILQEDTEAKGEEILVKEASPKGRYIRPAGMDFSAGDRLVSAFQPLRARHLGLLASAGIAACRVCAAPRVAIINSGDELVPVGTVPAAGQLVNSNGIMLSAMIEALGGIPICLAPIKDKAGALHERLEAQGPFDLIVTTGGASVGDHDHIVSDLENDPQSQLGFWRIAMRPGKPLIFANWRSQPLLGLPGNPVSTAVCSLLFVRQAICALQGRPTDITYQTAKLATDLPENDRREDYLRATLSVDADGQALARPFAKQDSAMLSRLTRADCLIIRAPHARPAKAGDSVSILTFPPLF